MQTATAAAVEQNKPVVRIYAKGVENPTVHNLFNLFVDRHLNYSDANDSIHYFWLLRHMKPDCTVTLPKHFDYNNKHLQNLFSLGLIIIERKQQ